MIWLFDIYQYTNPVHVDIFLLEFFCSFFCICYEWHHFNLVNRYKLSLIKPSVKALSVSSKVSMRTDHRGFLSLQYMIRNEDGQVCFVEYYVSQICFLVRFSFQTTLSAKHISIMFSHPILSSVHSMTVCFKSYQAAATLSSSSLLL